MSPTDFTFLNTTGLPGLSQSAAKRMRGHITKTNFAKRRQRIADAGGVSKPDGGDRSMRLVAIPEGGLPSIDLYRYTHLFIRYWSLVSSDNNDRPDPAEATWIEFLLSEPALFESIMAIGIQHGSSDISLQQLAGTHSAKAFDVTIQRISSGKAHTDAMLGAVLNMAFGERLVRNDHAWNIHVLGLAQLITERRSQGTLTLPLWFRSLIIMDSINAVLNFPRFYHKTIIEALSAYDDQSMLRMATLCGSVVGLRNSIEIYHQCQLAPEYVTKEIEEPLISLLSQAEALQAYDDPAVQASSSALKLILYLSWPPYSRTNLTPIAEELKEALCRLQIITCSYVDLTSCQLMIGAIAAGKGSQTRAWFVGKLKNAVEGLQSRGWNNPLQIVEKGLAVDASLTVMFRALWKELSDLSEARHVDIGHCSDKSTPDANFVENCIPKTIES